MNEERFEQLLQEMRDQTAPPEEVKAAQDRVWRRLAELRPLACEEFRPDLDDYAAGLLSESRRMLVDDHLGRCVDCRRALAEIRGTSKVVPLHAPRRARWTGWVGWAAAAAVVVAVLWMGRDSIDSALAPGGPRATVASVSGTLYRLSEGPLVAGAQLDDGEVVRTAAGSRAVLRLADGSQVEMNQRTELALRGAWSGDTIRLDRGDIIVEAAPQGRGRLRVATRDSVASVQGTIFAVSSSTAGSLVSVVEGSVAVTQPGYERVLEAGELAASSAALSRIELEQAISWSDEAERYYALLGELIGIEEALADVPGSGLRYQSRLLPYLPAGTIVYFAIPNLEGTIREALELVDERSRESAVLAEWWSSPDARELQTTLEHLQVITPLLGDEMLFVLSGETTTEEGSSAVESDVTPLFLAEIRSGRQQTLEEAIGNITDDSSDPVPYRIAGDLLLVSEADEDLDALVGALGGGASSPFAAEVAQRYQSGVDWLAGIDVTALGSEFREAEPSRVLGLSNVDYLFFEHRSGSAGDDTQATLSFAGTRVGIASWLASPGPIGSAEYVSAEAVAVTSASTRDPLQAFHELLSIGGEGLQSAVDEFEAETGIDIGADIAPFLGTDFTFAVERPAVPVPGWIAVLEVINPAVLDHTIQRFIDAYNAHLAPDEMESRVTFAQETVNGRAWTSLSGGPFSTLSPSWTYDRGYMIVTTDRALALRAISVRDSGSSLVASAGFQQRVPVGAGLHNSAFVWFNADSILQELASMVESPAIADLQGNRDPVLVVINGETERIHAASRSRLTSLALDLLLARGPVTQ